jgi:hypothetical protein
MAMYVTLDDVKKHLNVDDCFCDDDTYIEQLIEVAESVIERDTGCKLSEMEDGNRNIQSPIRHAIRLLVGNFYSNREPVVIGATPSQLPLSYKHLISTFMNY